MRLVGVEMPFPKTFKKGLDLGLVSPEILQNFFDLEQYPLISELTQRFQGFRERLLADPKFLNRLAIEEAISITTTLVAQYEKRKENFFEELDYVITDSVAVGDVIYIEANSGPVKRVGRSDAFATEFDLEAEEYVPLPKGEVHKKKEIVQLYRFLVKRYESKFNDFEEAFHEKSQ